MRADFLAAWTSNEYDSLSALLSVSTQEEVDVLMAVAERCVADGERMPFAYEGFQSDEPVIDEETGEITERSNIDDDDYHDGPCPDEPEPKEDERIIFLHQLARDYMAATNPERIKALHESYVALYDEFTAEDHAAVRGWRRAAVERIQPGYEKTKEQLDGIERGRQERAARNRETIEASRR